MSQDDSDRRRFFRITDRLGVSYRVLEPSEINDDLPSTIARATHLIAGYNQVIEDSLAALSDQPAVAAAIDALNKKLDCMLSQIELDNVMVQKMAHKMCEVNISACGMAFIIDESLQSNDILHLDLFFKPDDLHVVAKGRVIDCEPAEQAYYLRIEFVEMSQTDQERLIQHIVQRQGMLLRSLRDL